MAPLADNRLTIYSAMAVSLDPIGNVETHGNHRLVKRLNLPPSHTVYNFTFDYNFAVLKGRADSDDVLFRLDYSNDPGYWEDVVGKNYLLGL